MLWSSVLFALLCSSWAQQRPVRQQSHGPGPGWDIRLAVPGEPGRDYPTLGAVPRTSFSCSGRRPGYYADYEANCQVFRICTTGATYGFQSFLCPNGTLFNQAVFVCDWWMNVNCDPSQQFMNPTEDKFGNLKMGPKLMHDVKNMLTHPMRNPYDKSAMKSNFIVMQEYKMPNAQFLQQQQSQLRRPENVYVPSKQNYYNGNGFKENLVAGSTPTPFYSQPAANSIQNGRDVEVLQKQRQNGQQAPAKLQSHPSGAQFLQGNRIQSAKYSQVRQQFKQVQNGHTQNGQYYQTRPTHQAPTAAAFSNSFSNGHSGKLIQNSQSQTYSQQNQNVKHQKQQHHQQQTNNYQQQQQQQTNNYQQQQNNNYQRAQNQIAYQNQQNQNVQFAQAAMQAAKQQTELGFSFSRQPYHSNENTETKSQQPQFSNQVVGKVGNEAKQNLVSNTNPPTVIAKTLTFNRIIQPKPGSPKSRITFKTWIVKNPSKSSRLVAQPTAYTYNRPTARPTAAKLVAQPTAYYYDRPTTTAQAEKLVSDDGYYYNNPTVEPITQKIVQAEPYYYNPPTVTTVRENIVSEEGYSYNRPTAPAKQITIVTSTSPPPTIPPSVYLPPSTPTLPSRQYLAPTTYKPVANLYLPPPTRTVEIARQYLGPPQSGRLQASPSTASPVVVSPNRNSLFSLFKHSRVNTNLNNLTFTDILTKEKLDITVNDIVKDTSKVLATASSGQLGELRDDSKSVDYVDTTYIPPESPASEEVLSPAPPTEITKSSKLIQAPANDLLPPHETFNEHSDNTNPIANLPFIKEPSPTNTIERTVSLKITIPEKTAAYLFNTTQESDYDKLEILNTGSSNYLVLSNKLKNATPSFIPIGKLITGKNSNISNSQALVFSFLADSINQVNEYRNLAEASGLASQAQYQNVNHDELSQITNNIAQLTSSQYSNFLPTDTSTANIQSAKYTNQQSQPQHIQSGQYYTSHHNGAPSGKLQSDQNQIYSGQLYQSPVPEVSTIYNGEPARLVTQNNLQQTSEVEELAPAGHGEENQSSGEVEIVQSQAVPVATPAKLQAAPGEQSYNSLEDQSIRNFVTGDGISAQLQDKIVGTIAHPSQENKLVTYKKDQSYYVFTKFNEDQSGSGAQSEKLTQPGNAVTFQLIPSVGYQLDDESQQQKFLNAFQISGFGSKGGNAVLTSNVDYTVEHGGSRAPGSLYAGPSSYSAPQASVINANSKLEQFEDNANNNAGYSENAPPSAFRFK